MASGGPPTFCATDHGCITCADEGVEVTVVATAADGLAECADGNGVAGQVEVALVGDVAPGDALLVHAGVAIARLGPAEARG